ncbi:hypothetical protein BpHYR1_051718 [Brachionus plicatilis]|uniref:Uncharacterized protein n=1 Tax=Brachionus plicatilis TaxID=10195 RepID=A0A3M7PCR9_BRAPC|nr:hypothetical protein BpHYR1_051718 [Brachionus plicatilis]
MKVETIKGNVAIFSFSKPAQQVEPFESVTPIVSVESVTPEVPACTKRLKDRLSKILIDVEGQFMLRVVEEVVEDVVEELEEELKEELVEELVEGWSRSAILHYPKNAKIACSYTRSLGKCLRSHFLFETYFIILNIEFQRSFDSSTVRLNPNHLQKKRLLGVSFVSFWYFICENAKKSELITEPYETPALIEND